MDKCKCEHTQHHCTLADNCRVALMCKSIIDSDPVLIDELKLKAKMYHFVKKLTPREFAEIYDINIKTGVHFDHLIVQAMKGE